MPNLVEIRSKIFARFARDFRLPDLSGNKEPFLGITRVNILSFTVFGPWLRFAVYEILQNNSRYSLAISRGFEKY